MLLHAAGVDTGRRDVADQVAIRQRLNWHRRHLSDRYDEQMAHALEVWLQWRDALTTKLIEEHLAALRHAVAVGQCGKRSARQRGVVIDPRTVLAGAEKRDPVRR